MRYREAAKVSLRLKFFRYIDGPASCSNPIITTGYRLVVMSIEQTVVEKLRALPPEKQQEVLDFVEFLQAKTPRRELSNQDGKPVGSFLSLAQKWVGCLEGGPDDLSSNKKYLNGYGE